MAVFCKNHQAIDGFSFIFVPTKITPYMSKKILANDGIDAIGKELLEKAGFTVRKALRRTRYVCRKNSHERLIVSDCRGANSAMSNENAIGVMTEQAKNALQLSGRRKLHESRMIPFVRAS